MVRGQSKRQTLVVHKQKLAEAKHAEHKARVEAVKKAKREAKIEAKRQKA